MKIYLFRHGETEYNKTKRMQGQLDIPLNEYGRELARITGEALMDIPFDKAFCSPLNRAQETAKLMLGGRDLPVEIDERLLEIGVGSSDGGNFSEMRENPDHPLHNFLKHPENYVPQPDSESFEDVRLRGQDFIQNKLLPLEGQYETVLIVAHGCFNRCILNQLLNIPMEEFWKLSMPNCVCSLLEIENGELKLIEHGTIYYDGPANARP